MPECPTTSCSFSSDGFGLIILIDALWVCLSPLLHAMKLRRHHKGFMRCWLVYLHAIPRRMEVGGFSSRNVAFIGRDRGAMKPKSTIITMIANPSKYCSRGAMFYAQLVLAKKGLLGKVWLAAHWEKKLTRPQIFQTDISLTAGRKSRSTFYL